MHLGLSTMMQFNVFGDSFIKSHAIAFYHFGNPKIRSQEVNGEEAGTSLRCKTLKSENDLGFFKLSKSS